MRVISNGKLILRDLWFALMLESCHFRFYLQCPFLVKSLFVALSVTKNNVNLFLCYREEDLLIGRLVKKVNICCLVTMHTTTVQLYYN